MCIALCLLAFLQMLTFLMVIKYAHFTKVLSLEVLDLLKIVDKYIREEK